MHVQFSSLSADIIIQSSQYSFDSGCCVYSLLAGSLTVDLKVIFIGKHIVFVAMCYCRRKLGWRWIDLLLWFCRHRC